jgi:predicted lipoprotein
MGRRLRSPHRSRSRGRTPWLPLVAALVSVVVASCTVRPIGWEPSAGTGSGDNGGGVFDAKAYVTSIWSSKVLPTFDAKSVDAATLIAALAADPATAEKQYGTQAADGGPYSFMIKGSGKVLEAGADGLAVDLAPPDGKADVTINTGPVILGTALRDAVGFIKFGDFTNQVDYAQVSTEMKNEVKTTVLASFDATKAVGKTVDFEGALALSDTTSITAASIVIVPVRLTVGSGQ